MSEAHSDVLLKVLAVFVNNPWFSIILAVVIVILSYVALQLGLRTNVFHRFGISPKEGANPLNGAHQQVKERKTVKDGEVQDGKVDLTFTQKMKLKSTKIVDEGEKGEMKKAIEKCKKFLSTVQATNFACKIFINSWEDIDGIENFEKIVVNIGKQLKLPEEDIEGIKLSAMGGKSKKDYLAFECAMKNEGAVRLHTGGYQVTKHDTEKIDFQIALNYMDMSDITLKLLPGGAGDNLESKWFRSSSALEYQKPDEGEDWNSYFQYTAHKNILKELHEE